MMIWCFFRRTLNHAALQALQQILLQMSWMGYTRLEVVFVGEFSQDETGYAFGLVCREWGLFRCHFSLCCYDAFYTARQQGACDFVGKHRGGGSSGRDNGNGANQGGFSKDRFILCNRLFRSIDHFFYVRAGSDDALECTTVLEVGVVRCGNVSLGVAGCHVGQAIRGHVGVKEDNMPDWITVILLGFVEGITEFLPVSSTGHLIVVSDWLGLNPALQGTFEIVIQFGAVLAVIAYFWRDLYQQIRITPTDARAQRFWLAVMVAFIPAAVIGLLFEDTIDRLLQSNQVVATALILGGFLFLIIEWAGFSSRANLDDELLDINLLQAFAIGLIQSLALIPGTSRSGMSIIGGLVVGLNRRVATQFSFYLSIPTLGVATLYKGVTDFSSLPLDNILLVVLGTVISAVVAWWSIGWLLKFVSTNTFTPFGYYRIVVGILILFVVA